ncbi:hypothetical protein BC830DRAFT_1095345 [Chytriomyces sp. MP71]|nr:hypothetical protein BC830DRAFT_1095345 [Chytriomyces sp. MP71]
MPLKVIIIGTGLVGAALAIALKKAGHEPTLYDKFDLAGAAVTAQANSEPLIFQFGDTGGHVMIQSNGLRVLKSLGVLDEIRRLGLSSGSAETSYMDGSGAARANLFGVKEDEDVKVPVQILRSMLHSILVRECHRAGVKTFTGKRLVQVQATETRVTAVFDDGTTAVGDLLVGADGIHSATRRLLFGEDVAARFSGLVGFIGTVDLGVHNIKLHHPTTFHIDRVKRREVVVFKVAEDKAAWRVTEYADPDPEATDNWRPYSNLPKNAERLAGLTESWGLPAEFVACIRNSNRITPVSMYDLPNVASYHKGRTLLVGDAAHGMLPNFGSGLSVGLEDVGTLYELFTQFSEGEVFKILDAYNAIRVPRAHGIANRSRGIASTVYADSQFGASVNHFKMRIFYYLLNHGFVPHPNEYDHARAVKSFLAK